MQELQTFFLIALFRPLPLRGTLRFNRPQVLQKCSKRHGCFCPMVLYCGRLGEFRSLRGATKGRCPLETCQPFEKGWTPNFSCAPAQLQPSSIYKSYNERFLLQSLSLWGYFFAKFVKKARCFFSNSTKSLF